MAWTTPGTATAGEVLTAAFWNTQVRDNLNDIRMAQMCTYVWTSWNPTNNTGTNTNAPSTSVHDIANATYFSQANSSGTLTITCKVAGYYRVAAGMSLQATSPFTYFRGTVAFGGTSTIYDPAENTLHIAADSSADVNGSGFASYMVLATANQTITILPSGNVSAAVAASNFSLYAFAHCEFVGGSLT